MLSLSHIVYSYNHVIMKYGMLFYLPNSITRRQNVSWKTIAQYFQVLSTFATTIMYFGVKYRGETSSGRNMSSESYAVIDIQTESAIASSCHYPLLYPSRGGSRGMQLWLVPR